MTPRDACVELARQLGADPDDLVDAWTERAAIREFEGGQARADAERDAVEDLRRELDLTTLASAPRRGPLRVAAASSVERRERNR
jgi:hypothetical protein